MSSSIPRRTQNDGYGDQASISSGLVFDPINDDFTRQEFTQDADVNVILRRYGANLPLRPVQFGEVDTDLDLMGAYASVDAAREAHASLPDNLREAFPTWQSLAEALAQGKVTVEPSPVGEGLRPESNGDAPPAGDAK